MHPGLRHGNTCDVTDIADWVCHALPWRSCRRTSTQSIDPRCHTSTCSRCALPSSATNLTSSSCTPTPPGLASPLPTQSHTPHTPHTVSGLGGRQIACSGSNTTSSLGCGWSWTTKGEHESIRIAACHRVLARVRSHSFFVTNGLNFLLDPDVFKCTLHNQGRWRNLQSSSEKIHPRANKQECCVGPPHESRSFQMCVV